MSLGAADVAEGQCGMWYCQSTRTMVIGKGEGGIYQVLCDETFPRETQPQCLPILHRIPQLTNVQTPLKSNLMNQRVVLGCG